LTAPPAVLPVPRPKTTKDYDQRTTEQAFQALERDLSEKYDRRSDLILDPGKELVLTADNSSAQYGIGIDNSGYLRILDYSDGTIGTFSVAWSNVDGAAQEITNLTTYVDAADATLQASIDTNASTSATNGTAISVLETEITVAREGEASLLANITDVRTAFASADAAEATARTALTARFDESQVANGAPPLSDTDAWEFDTVAWTYQDNATYGPSYLSPQANTRVRPVEYAHLDPLGYYKITVVAVGVTADTGLSDCLWRIGYDTFDASGAVVNYNNQTASLAIAVGQVQEQTFTFRGPDAASAPGYTLAAGAGAVSFKPQARSNPSVAGRAGDGQIRVISFTVERVRETVALEASITSEETARIAGDAAEAAARTSLQTTLEAADTTLQANIDAEESARVTADTAEAAARTTLSATVGTNTSSINNLSEAYATDSSGTARLVWTVAVGSNVATLEQTAATGYSDGTWNGSAISLTASEIILDGAVLTTGTVARTALSSEERDALGAEGVAANFYRQSSDPGSVPDGSWWADTGNSELNIRISSAWQKIADIGGDQFRASGTSYLTAEVSGSGSGTATTSAPSITVSGDVGSLTYLWRQKSTDTLVSCSNTAIINPTFSRTMSAAPTSAVQTLWTLYITDATLGETIQWDVIVNFTNSF